MLCTNTEWNKTRNENESKQHSQSITTTKEVLLLLEARACTQIQTQKMTLYDGICHKNTSEHLNDLPKKAPHASGALVPAAVFSPFLSTN